MKWLATVLCFVASVGLADIIPADRLVEWSTNTCGIPGGIPYRTSVFTNFTASNLLTNARAKIQYALNACTNNGVVLLPAGNFITDGIGIKVPSYVTLRGAGLSKTFLIGAAPSANNLQGIIYIGSDPGDKHVYSISSGSTKGSESVTLSSSPSELSVGSIISIDQKDDDSTLIFGTDQYSSKQPANSPNQMCSISERGGSYGDSWDGWNHHNSQNVMVTNVSANVVKFTPPLVWYFTNLPSVFFRSGASNSYAWWAGVEDLSVSNTYSAGSVDDGKAHNLNMAMAAYCWFKNVGSWSAFCMHAGIEYSYRPEVRQCLFTNNLWYSSGGSYGVHINHTSSGLFEDNIFKRTRDFFRVHWGSAGNAILYNYHTNVLGQIDTGKCAASGGSHGAHPVMNLWEGNITYTPLYDDTWGSASHVTLLRNWFRGPDIDESPAPGSPYPELNDLFSPLDFFKWQHYHNIVGNILGHPIWINDSRYTSKVCIRISNQTWNNSQYATIAIGYTANGDVPTNHINATNQWNTFIYGGNYDYVVGAQIWSNPATPASIVNSHFYASPPTNWGVLYWPPFNPTNATLNGGIAGLTMETMIPAGWRCAYGTNPPIQVLTISPQNASNSYPNCVQYTATVDFGSGVTTNVSSSSSWTVTDYLLGIPNPAVSVTANGLACISNAAQYRININAAWSNLTAVSTLTVTNTQPTPTTNPIVCNVQWWAPRIFGFIGCGPVGLPSIFTNYMLTFKTSPECTISGSFEGSLFFNDNSPKTIHTFTFSTNQINTLIGPPPSPHTINCDFQCTSTNGGITVVLLTSVPLGCPNEVVGAVLWNPGSCLEGSGMTVMY